MESLRSGTLAPTREGSVPFNIPSISKPCFTYYKIFGDLKGGGTPLVCVHGGPGAGHSTYLPFVELWPLYGIPIVLYDQIGCGESTRLPETAGDESFWQIPLFVSELNNLVDHLQLRDGSGFYLIGRSFGGYIATEFATTRPRGLQRLVLGSASASRELSLQSFEEVRDGMPDEHRQAILEAVREKDFESPGYKTAWNFFIKTYLVRTNTEVQAPELQAALKNIDSDRTVHNTM